MRHTVQASQTYQFNPDAPSIDQFLRQEFPQALAGNPEDILNAVGDAIISGGSIRLGGRPNPESLVAIRSVIRTHIQAQLPIPLIVPAGPKKPQAGESIDIAELSALRMIGCLQKRVKAVYEPGIIARIRLEDITGFYLEDTDPKTQKSMSLYLHDFETLVQALGYTDFIQPVRESSFVAELDFRTTADSLVPLFQTYIDDTTDGLNGYESLASWKALSGAGWKGEIPIKMREFYQHRFERIYPNVSVKERTYRICRYLASTLTHHKLGLSGSDPAWKSYLSLSFTPPVPHAPASLVSTRVFYRTVPTNHTKHHIPFWRAKGFLKSTRSGWRIQLASWDDGLDLHRHEVIFSQGGVSVPVRTDYLLDE